MTPKFSDPVEKKWITDQLQHIGSLKTVAGLQKGIQRFQKTVLEKLEGKIKPQSVRQYPVSRSISKVLLLISSYLVHCKRYDIRPSGRNLRVENSGRSSGRTIGAPQRNLRGSKISKYSRSSHFKLSITDLPQGANLARLEKAQYDRSTEAYNRIAVDYMIVACMVEHKNLLRKQSELAADHFHQSKVPANDPTATISPILEQSELQTDDPHDQRARIVPGVDQPIEIPSPPNIAPATPSTAPKSTSQRLPIKVFPEMALCVRVKRGEQAWEISGIADWAMGYGDRAVLEDGAVLLAVEAKRSDRIGKGEAQLLAYLATVRQLRIQANKKNVMTQGFYSDGAIYRFLCIRNNGTVMRSGLYDVFMRGQLKTVFNFLLGMLTTAAESSRPTKPGQDERIENFDRDVFVEVSVRRIYRVPHFITMRWRKEKNCLM
jgi:hypothetical protein